MEKQEQVHQRRVRYSGTHPKNFQEKYKELQPEKYADTIAKVIESGSTPAGMHIPICVTEIMDFLQIQPGQVGLDATLGYGGHSLEMLKCLDGQGHLYAIDVDPIESLKTQTRLQKLGFGPEQLTIELLNFADLDVLAELNGPFDFVLADLGLSSMQIDNPARGFSFKKDGPLDLRLNPQTGISAKQRLQTISQAELQGMLTENADEPYAAEISHAIISARQQHLPITTTRELQQIISQTLQFLPTAQRKELIKKSCQRTFQALRIDVNKELEVLFTFLEKLPTALAHNGRVAILTFHSGEDRLVKKAFKQHFREGLYREIATEVIRPSPAECYRNSRAHSAKLRWAIKS